MAPEVICQQPHSFTVDYFAVGVLLYEFMTGKRPYPGRTRKEIKDQVLTRQATATSEQLPANWDPTALDLINRLLQRKPTHRLGAGGLAEVKAHPWFAALDWEALMDKSLEAPLIPQGDHNFSSRLGKTHNVWKDARSDTMIANISLLQNRATQQLFAEYEFDNSACNSPS
jgi:serum/glucocorticoid-regulated kinase 1/serum/glucocorticoid-regulated kinase 2